MGRVTSDGRKTNGKWVDRWRENGQHCQRTFDRKRDRDEFRTWRRRQQQLGRPIVRELEAKPTLAAFMEDYWTLYAIPNLESSTRANYLQQWGKWIRPRLGSLQLDAITTKLINRQLVAPMRKAGASDSTVAYVLAVLQSVLTLAVDEDLLEVNPVAKVKVPRPKVERQLDPIPPSTVERARARIGERDATILSLLGYQGLRPGELLALDVDDLTEKGILVRRANVDGRLREYPKNQRNRLVPWTAPEVRFDIRDYMMAAGIRTGVLFPDELGAPMHKHDWDNWRKRVWQDLAVDVGLGRYEERRGKPPLYRGAVPYDLRGSFVSLLAWEGYTMLECAQRAGHGVVVCETHYAKIFADVDPAKRTTAAEAIRAAREPGVRGVFALPGLEASK